MKYRKRLSSSFFYFLASLTLFVGAIKAQQDPDAITWIPQITTPPVIDGQIDDIWQATQPLSINRLQNGSVENDADLSAVWYGLWDDSNYYFLVDITDQHLESEKGGAVFRNDRIEVYFNMDNLKPAGNAFTGDNYQYAFNWNRPNNRYVSGNGSWTGLEWAQIDTDHGYIIEVKIPWTTLTNEFTAEVDWSFGFDIAINDNDGTEYSDSVTYWWNSLLQPEWTNTDGTGTVGLDSPFNGNFAPTFTNIAVHEATEGLTSDLTLSASDLNPADALVFSVQDLPAFAQLTNNNDGTATISVNPTTGDANIYTISATVSDGEKEDTQELFLIVKDPLVENQIPVIQPIADVSVVRGDLLPVDVSVTDLDSLSVFITGLDNPDWVSIVDNGDKTASVKLNPGLDIVTQAYTITVVATDSTETSSQTSFTATVLSDAARTTYYCDPINGSMSNDGSPESPWGSLSDVIDAGKLFAPGDTLYLMDGYHGEPSITNANSDYVFIRPADVANPTLAQLHFKAGSAYWDASDLNISRSYASTINIIAMISINGEFNRVSNCDIFSKIDTSSWTLTDWLTTPADGVEILGTNNTIEDSYIFNVAMGITIGGSHSTIKGNRIKNFSVDGMRCFASDNLIENNFISDNYNIDDNHDDGFQAWTNGTTGVGSGVISGIILRGNTVIQQTDPNLTFPGPLQGFGCFDGMFEDWIVENNTILVNHHNGLSLYGAINCKIVNNTVIDFDPDKYPDNTFITIEPHKRYEGETDPELKAYYNGRDNLVRNNLATNLIDQPRLGTFDHNIFVSTSKLDTYFVNFPDDMRLKPESPAIDAGSNDQAPAFDAVGNIRPFDGDANGSAITDLGAFEYTSWRGFPIINGWVNTGSNYLGWLYTPSAQWQYSFSIGQWLHVPESLFNQNAGWVYFQNYGNTDLGWYQSTEFNTWIYNNQSGAGGWSYLLNTSL